MQVTKTSHLVNSINYDRIYIFGPPTITVLVVLQNLQQLKLTLPAPNSTMATTLITELKPPSSHCCWYQSRLLTPNIYPQLWKLDTLRTAPQIQTSNPRIILKPPIGYPMIRSIRKPNIPILARPIQLDSRNSRVFNTRLESRLLFQDLESQTRRSMPCNMAM